MTVVAWWLSLHTTPLVSLTQKPQQSQKRIGWDYCAPLHQNDLPRGKFDWLKRSIRSCFPCGRMEAQSNAPAEQVHNTYLYLQSVDHLYLYTFHLCFASYLCTPGCVPHLCGEICLLCISTIILFIYLLCCSLFRSKPRGI